MNDLLLHRAAQLLEAEFGPQWRTVADMLGTEGLRKRVGKELTSFMAYPEPVSYTHLTLPTILRV